MREALRIIDRPIQIDRRSMARPREFDIDEALRRACMLFRRRGYHATTTRELDVAIGIGHQSLYTAFGDKPSLFRRALAFYIARDLGPRVEPVESARALKRDIVRLLAQMVEFYDAEAPGSGCLLFDVALERINDDAEVAEMAAGFTRRLEEALRDTLERSREAGDVPTGLDPAAVSRSLVCTVMGLAVASRIGCGREQLVDMASTALRPLY